MNNHSELTEFEACNNPLDNVEDVLNAHDWTFNRINDDELVVRVAGKSCNYRLFFIWQESMSALQFCCQYDMTVCEQNFAAVREAMMDINENLWMGHFDLPRQTGTPSYRHTCLFRGVEQSAAIERLEDLMDISLALCEKHYPVFSLIADASSMDRQTLDLALMETRGES